MNRTTTLLPQLVKYACFLFAVLCLAEQSSARTFFVASSANASDENSGTSTEPVRSIRAGISLAEPGDLVYVRPGDYRTESTGFGDGVIPVLKSGTPSNPICVRSSRKNPAIVTKFLAIDRHDVIIESFNFQGLDFSTLDGWEPMPTIVRDTLQVSETADEPERPDFSQPYETRQTRIETEFATYFDQVNRVGFDIGVDLERCQRISVNDNQVAGYFAGIQCRGCEQMMIQNNKIQECFNGIFVFNTSDPNQPGLIESTISLNDISQSLDNGIDIRANSRSVRIEDNRIRYSGRSHISLRDGAERCRVRFNRVCFGGYYSETMVFPGSSAISLNDAGINNVVSDNLVSRQIDLTGIDGNGIIVDFMRENAKAVIRDNVSWRNMGAGMNLTVSPGTVVAGNCFGFNGSGATERRRGAGLKISRDEDIENRIVDNSFVFNRAAGILSSDTINLQFFVNRNFYITDGAPLIWDGFNDGEREYRSLLEIQANTPWERRGSEFLLSR